MRKEIIANKKRHTFQEYMEKNSINSIKYTNYSLWKATNNIKDDITQVFTPIRKFAA